MEDLYKQNQKIGKLTLKYSWKTRNHTIWKCICDCGKICYIKEQYFTDGIIDCGCGAITNYKSTPHLNVKNGNGRTIIITDLSGNIYGQYAVIRYAGIHDHQTQWFCTCLYCGSEIILSKKVLWHIRSHPQCPKCQRIQLRNNKC